MSHQNIKDRYYGVNDPVAKRILARAKEGALHPPENRAITTLYIGGVVPGVTDSDLRYSILHPHVFCNPTAAATHTLSLTHTHSHSLTHTLSLSLTLCHVWFC
jgi:hypothetical protein